jgi:hypothetical protein
LLFHHVEFLLVGGHALAFHGAPPFTVDIDFLILSNPGNASKLMEVMADFGFSGTELTAADFLVPDRVIQLGVAPCRIDLLTSITGVPWEEAWATRESVELDDYTIPVIGKAALIRNKAATNRLQDKADIARLTQ